MVLSGTCPPNREQVGCHQANVGLGKAGMITSSGEPNNVLLIKCDANNHDNDINERMGWEWHRMNGTGSGRKYVGMKWDWESIPLQNFSWYFT